MGSLDVMPQWHPEPRYHLKAPSGWINDPCAPGYDPSTGTYHLFYQCLSISQSFRDATDTIIGNPKSCDWGQICWGHFTSKDGIRWKEDPKGPAIVPSMPYDKEGIFTGCFWPTGPHGEKGQLTVIYSSVQHLPIHWTIPYTRDCAGLAIAASSDGGRSWQKSPLNPVLKGEPEGLTVTGFRDPFLAEWSAMDEIRGEKKLYGIVSGGVVGEGPNAFVYAVSPDDLTTWTYLGPLCDVAVGAQRPSHWTGDLGVNWECVNFMELGKGPTKTNFLLMGTEGGHRREAAPGEDCHGVWSMWVGGDLKQTVDGPRMENEFSGLLDNGNFYAANSYEHPKTKERIVWGWVKEDELTLKRRETKGWTGYLSLPREVFLLNIHNVLGALQTPLSDIPSLKVSKNQGGSGSQTVQTLGIRPQRNMASLRSSKPRTWLNLAEPMGRLTTPASASWELEAVVRVSPRHHRVGFHLHHNHNLSKRTSVFFKPSEESIRVGRSHSNNESDITKDDVHGPFTLFRLEQAGAAVWEKLHLRIFADGDVLEVFANDRFALSTVVYADGFDSAGVSWFAEGGNDEGVVFESISLWDDMGRVQQRH